MTKLYDSNEISKLFVFWDDEMPGQAGHDGGANRHGRRDRPSGITRERTVMADVIGHLA